MMTTLDSIAFCHGIVVGQMDYGEIDKKVGERLCNTLEKIKKEVVELQREKTLYKIRAQKAGLCGDIPQQENA